MSFIRALTLAVLILAYHVCGFSAGQLQPGCHPPPVIPSNFTKWPNHWRYSPTWLAPRQSGKVWSGWHNVQYLFSFGDSYTTTSFNISGEQPNPNNPLGNPSYPGVTSSNGPNYVDFLTTTYNASYIQTYNFGFGGATIDPNLVDSAFGLTVQSFEQQVTNEFDPDYANKVIVPWTSANSLFTVFFGINDVIRSYTKHNSSLNYALIKRYEDLVHSLYASGARNFVFLNVPPIDRSPGALILSASTQAYIAEYVGEFNFRLGVLVYNLGAHYPDTTSFYFDTNWLFTIVLNNPSSFQATSSYHNTTGYCAAYQNGTPTLSYFDPSCEVPVDQYMWLNDLHPTYPIHNLIASRIVQQLGG